MDFEFNEMSDDELNSVLGEISEHTQQRVNSKIAEVLSLYDDVIPPTIKYDLKGHTGGYARSDNVIRLNVDILNNPKHTEDMINQVVPHEVAHIIVFQKWPGAQAHGREWRHVMWRLGLPADRCHQFETTAARKSRPRAKPYVYYCDCDTPHEVTNLMHTRIMDRIARGHGHYFCKRCKAYLRERR